MAYDRIPGFGPAANRTFNRSRFLDGTYATYFAPGQRLDVLASYYAPTDWRPANSILTPPQVVWLTLGQVDATQPSYQGAYSADAVVYGETGTVIDVPSPQQSGAEYPVATATWTYSNGATVQWATYQTTWGGSPGPVVNPGNNVSVFRSAITAGSNYVLGPMSYAQYQAQIANTASAANVQWLNTNYPSVTLSGGSWQADWTDTLWVAVPVLIDAGGGQLVSFPNPYAADYVGLARAFRQAADTINALRPGKTWVYVWDLTLGSPNKDWQLLQGTDSHPPWVSALLAPSGSDAPFFGVDFLHVFTGASCVLLDAPLVGGMAIPGAVAYDPYFNSPGEADVQASYDAFYRFAVQLYGVKDGQATVPQPARQNPVQPLPDSVATALVNAGVISAQGGFGQPASFYIQAIQDFLGRANQAEYQTLTGLSQIPGTANARLQQIASDLSRCGYAYRGDEAQLQSAETVVGLIAGHFNFDPDTGLDLPAPRA